jgi:hypothetical protein
MRRIVSVAMFVTSLLAVSAVVRAQDCSNWSNWDIRGIYTMSGSGWIDLSKALPGLGMPTGLIPMSWVGAKTLDGVGGGVGWVSINSAGNQMSAQLVGMKYSIKPDCSIQESFSLKINELPPNLPPVGPISRLMVPVGKPDALELHMIWQGTAPGTPTGPVVDSGVAYRIWMRY